MLVSLQQGSATKFLFGVGVSATPLDALNGGDPLPVALDPRSSIDVSVASSGLLSLVCRQGNTACTTRLSADALKERVESLEARGQSVKALLLEVTDAASVEALFSR